MLIPFQVGSLTAARADNAVLNVRVHSGLGVICGQAPPSPDLFARTAGGTAI